MVFIEILMFFIRLGIDKKNNVCDSTLCLYVGSFYA